MPSKLKRVLWISDYFPRPHDTTTGTWALESILAIQRQGTEVVVLSPTPWIPRLLAWNSRLAGWAAVPGEANIKGVPAFYPKCPHYPHRLVTQHFYNFFPFFDSSFIWPWCEKTVSEILTRYPFQAVHANFIFPGGFLGCEIKKKYGMPLVVHERSLTRLTAARGHRERSKIYGRVIREADAVITINHQMAKMIEATAGNGTAVNVIRDGGTSGPVRTPEDGEEHIKVIVSGGYAPSTTDFIEARPERYGGFKVILCVGSFIKRKGQEYLVRAVEKIKKEIPRFKCLLIGCGENYKRIQDLVRELDLENEMELWGQRPHEEVLWTMSWCDVFALPSWNEPQGTVYGEAMSFAKPIIACRGEGISEILEDHVHGILVPPKDVESLAQALKTLLNDAQLASRLGKEAAVLAGEKLNYDTIASEITQLYRRILA